MDKSEDMNTSASVKLFTKNVPHIFEKIFFSLDYNSFMICMKVNNSWSEVLTSESFKRIGKFVFREDIARELYRASDDGNLKEVRNIISSDMADLNCICGPLNATSLCYASRKGHRDIVKLFLDNGGDPNKAAKNRRTPLHWAAVMNQKALVQLLLDRGADPNKTEGYLGSPLNFAALEGHRDVVEVLLNGGAEPNQADGDGWTPLHNASYYGHKDVVLLLLIRRADPRNMTVLGNTPIDLALPNGHTDIVNILQGGAA